LEVIDERSADRPVYVRTFFAAWETAVTNVNRVADAILNHQQVILDDDIWKTLLTPYSSFQIIYSSRLIDHLETEELSRFAAVCEHLNGAWQKFFAATLVRHPDIRELVDRISENRRTAHEETVDLFTGESLPTLSGRWAAAMRELQFALKPLAEGLQK